MNSCTSTCRCRFLSVACPPPPTTPSFAVPMCKETHGLHLYSISALLKGRTTRSGEPPAEKSRATACAYTPRSVSFVQHAAKAPPAETKDSLALVSEGPTARSTKDQNVYFFFRSPSELHQRIPEHFKLVDSVIWWLEAQLGPRMRLPWRQARRRAR